MKTVATADGVYVDPRALLKLYLRGPESRAMTAWRAKIRAPLTITHHGRVELLNAVGLAFNRQFIAQSVHRAAIEAIDEDFSCGRYVLADLLWRATLTRAAEISRAYTPALGCRSLDVLHVSSALELGMRQFVTFDRRQQALAKALDLRVVTPNTA